jgi:alpha-glucosidase
MHKRRVFTLDEAYFPLARMQEIVSHLHANAQHYVLMVDPAVAYVPGGDYPPFDRGEAAGVWIKLANGTSMKGVVWPGVTVYPDWFNNATQAYWDNEFKIMFDPKTGVDIDGAWIDMNEPASVSGCPDFTWTCFAEQNGQFCEYPCTDPFGAAVLQGLPPNRSTAPPPADVALFTQQKGRRRRAYHGPGEQLDVPPFNIQNAAGVGLPGRTSETTGVHANGLIEYDTRESPLVMCWGCGWLMDGAR